MALVVGLLFAGSAQAQIAVYKLKFDPAGESINYQPYESGYYMAPIGGGTGSLILLRTTSGQKQYFTYSNFGELFVAVKGSTRKAVITATATNDVSTTTFYAIGDAKDKMKVETRSAEANVYTASTLRGYAVSADSERDLPFSSSSATDLGVAGASLLTCILDEGMTADAIAKNRALADEVTTVQTFLASKGFTNGRPTTGAGGAGGGTGGAGG